MSTPELGPSEWHTAGAQWINAPSIYFHPMLVGQKALFTAFLPLWDDRCMCITICGSLSWWLFLDTLQGNSKERLLPKKAVRSRSHLSWALNDEFSTHKLILLEALSLFPRANMVVERWEELRRGSRAWGQKRPSMSLSTRTRPICPSARPRRKAKAIIQLVWVNAKAQLGFTVTHIDFGSWRVSAPCKLEDLSAGTIEISGFEHKYFSFLFFSLNEEC